MPCNTETPVTIDYANQLIVQFSKHMTCWKVGLATGSLVYFDMGERLWWRSKRSWLLEHGSSSLSLEGHQWKIFAADDLITSSPNVTRDIVDGELSARFVGQTLQHIFLSSTDNTASIVFSSELEIRFGNSGDPAYPDTELFILGFPDRSYLAYDVSDGFTLERLESQNYGDST